MVPKPVLNDIHNVIAVFKTIVKKFTSINVSDALYQFETATGTNFLDLFPQGNEELPKLFESLTEFQIDEQGNVTLKLDKNEDLEKLKSEYLVTAEDKKKCKRVDT